MQEVNKNLSNWHSTSSVGARSLPSMKTLLTLISTSIFATAVLSTPVLAAVLTERELRREVTKSAQVCPDLDCEQASIRAEFADLSQLSKAGQARLLEIAEHFVQVWGDTILEGDYIAADHFELDEVEILSHRGQATGFRISYSAQAWDTGTCNYNSEYPESIEDCLEGRIAEKAVVTLNGQGYFVDPTHFAAFYE
jgi:hypothetical protein